MKKIIKELIVSVLLSLILIFILSVIISTTSVSENLINPITIAITTFALMIGAFRVSREKKEKGIIYGSLLGLLYNNDNFGNIRRSSRWNYRSKFLK